jgi:Ca2+-binding EF-hand superfamily protein
MTKYWSFLGAAMLLAGSSLAFAADDKPKRDPEEVFKKLDKDGDGKVSLAEFVGKKTGEKATTAETMFKAKDADSDGFLTLDEFKAKKKK